jgi:LPXTG-motif cell wall-anchored protein
LSPWVLLGAGAALALVAGLFLFLRRRRRDETDREPTDVDARDASPPVREPRPAAAEPPVTPTAPRAWLEVDLRPERAAATENGATVHYELTLRNTGDAPARNIRIDPKLFNGAAEAEIAAFLQGPIHDVSGSPHIVVAAGASLRLKAEVAMPLADIREIEVQGVRIFVPAVAVNVAYDWTGGSGRTSRSWLVGREAEAQSPKMGAFRLDRGPRVYRQVGQREARKVMV